MIRTAVTLFTLTASAFAATDLFETRIRPVLAQRCYPCHSAQAASPQGGLRLDTTAGIRKGGNSGAAVVAGDPDGSLLVRAIRGSDSKLTMPPGSKGLPREVVAAFEEWVRSGAELPVDRTQPEPAARRELWSLKKPVRTGPPDIDKFIAARLGEKGLSMSAEADRRTLIRRATLDLLGLPPTAAEVEAFVSDKRSDAWERLIDRLLASPRYGERWGRHWLDVARYADSANDSVNTGLKYAWSWTYRDWVIRSLNEDLPYNEFLLYQLAADQAAKDPKHLAALGFLSLGREFPNSYAETVDDRIDAVARGMLGLTVACARCHDHKYDPIPTKDYYSFYSIFSNIREPRDLPAIGVHASKPDARQAEYSRRLDKIREAEKEYRDRRNAEMVTFFKSQTADYLIAAHDAEKLSNPDIEELVRNRQLNLFLLNRWRKYLDASKKSGEPVFRAWHSMAASNALPDVSTAHPLLRPHLAGVASLKDLATVYAKVLIEHDKPEPYADPSAEQLRAVMRGPQSPADVSPAQFDSIATEGDGNNLRTIQVRYLTMLARAAYDGFEARAMAVEDKPDAAPAHVFLRGNPNNPGALAPAHFLTCIGGSEDHLFTKGSGRLELAQAIIDPQNPLTARVIVNRVWMHHFGAGLVRTPSDFGFRGEAPTHPELLDNLAVAFVQDYKWSLKKLHRTIMLSAAYRQSSADNEAARKLDPENTLLWRMNRQRLDIESLRDASLVAAGRLDTEHAGGVPFALEAEPSIPRRTVYGFIERGRLPGFLNAFDFASPDQHAPLRYVTTVPQQALYFLNSPFIAEQARHVAARSKTIPEMYQAVFARSPQQWEIEAGERWLRTQGEAAIPTKPASAWQYGTLDANSGNLRVFPSFVGDRWQGGPSLPDAVHGNAFLRAAGGETSERDPVVRRWTSPVSGKISIEGTLTHRQPAVPFGDGVHGRVVSSRLGELASFSVNGSAAETKLTGIAVQQGDTIDFIVESRTDPENDGFSWVPVIKQGNQTWSASEDFAGPTPKPLTAWERYAQVLLQTNEFAFVD